MAVFLATASTALIFFTNPLLHDNPVQQSTYHPL